MWRQKASLPRFILLLFLSTPTGKGSSPVSSFQFTPAEVHDALTIFSQGVLRQGKRPQSFKKEDVETLNDPMIKSDRFSKYIQFKILNDDNYELIIEGLDQKEITISNFRLDTNKIARVSLLNCSYETININLQTDILLLNCSPYRDQITHTVHLTGAFNLTIVSFLNDIDAAFTIFSPNINNNINVNLFGIFCSCEIHGHYFTIEFYVHSRYIYLNHLNCIELFAHVFILNQLSVCDSQIQNAAFTGYSAIFFSKLLTIKNEISFFISRPSIIKFEECTLKHLFVSGNYDISMKEPIFIGIKETPIDSSMFIEGLFEFKIDGCNCPKFQIGGGNSDVKGSTFITHFSVKSFNSKSVKFPKNCLMQLVLLEIFDDTVFDFGELPLARHYWPHPMSGNLQGLDQWFKSFVQIESKLEGSDATLHRDFVRWMTQHFRYRTTPDQNTKFLLELYKDFSGFGLNPFAPLMWLLCFGGLFAGIHWFVEVVSCFISTGTLSLIDVQWRPYVFRPAISGVFPLNFSEINGEVHILLTSLHNLVSGALWFLFGLTIRNHARIQS